MLDTERGEPIPVDAQAPYSAPRWVRLAGRAGPYLLAFALPLVVIALATVLGGSNPFNGPAGLTNDAVNQLLPMHAHLWDLLHGRGPGDILWNWNSAYGVPFLPDYATYLSSPYAPLVALFPRNEITWAMFAVSSLKYATAGVGMTWYLLSAYGGRRWAAPFFGLAYAVCGWAVDDAAYVTMWLDGLMMLPFLLLAAEWCLDRRRWGWTALIVGITWWANFYTGFMATLLASCVLVTRALVREDLTWGTRLRGALRWGTAAITGVGLSAPVLLPLLAAVKAHVATPARDFHPIAWTAFAARLVPATEGDGWSPSLAVGTLVLLLALALPAAAKVPLRQRVGWSVLTVVIALSMQWPPTQLLWHGGESPNGSAFRQAFVLCALLVVAAWLVVSRGRPSMRALLFGGACTLLIVTADRLSGFWDPVSGVVVTISLAAGGLCYLAVRHGGRRSLLPVAVVLAAVMAGEQVASAVEIGNLRNRHLRQVSNVMSAHGRTTAAAIGAAQAGTSGRVGLSGVLTQNDPLLVRAEYGSYYSSLAPRAVSDQLQAGGIPWTGNGRNLIDSPGDPVLDSIYGVTRRVKVTGRRVEVRTSAAAPLVTWRAAAADMARRGDDPFLVQSQLLGDPLVYGLPQVSVRPGIGVLAVVPTASGYRIDHGGGAERFTLVGSCRPGTQVVAWLPLLHGSVAQGGVRLWLPSVNLGTAFGLSKANGVVWLGRTPASGTVRLHIFSRAVTTVPRQPFGCLDISRWRSAIAALAASPVGSVRFGGHSFAFRAHAPGNGVAVLATAFQPGWRCSLDGSAPRPAVSWHGLLGTLVPSGEHRLSCGYTPARLWLGLGTFTGLLGVIALVLFLAARRVRHAIGLAARRAVTAARWRRRADVKGASREDA